MGALRFDKFGGQIPVLDDRLLPMENSAYSENAFLQGGALEPLAADIDVHTLANPLARYAFRVPIGSPALNDITNSKWLEFEDANTSVVRSPVASTIDGGRYYWANGTSPPGYTTKERLLETPPLPPLLIGIPRPIHIPWTTPLDTVTEPLVTRAYVYTYVSSLGEEGQQSPPDVRTGYGGDTWVVKVTAPTAAQAAGRDLKTMRIYRSESTEDEQGNALAAFFFVADVPIPQPIVDPPAEVTYNDTNASELITSNEQLPSADWAGPPKNLAGLVSMPNGMIAGWRGNEVWFCEPFRPHAWPTKYMISVDAPIVGLGTIDQNLMILTSGQPWVATGIHPSAISLRKVQPLEPCTAQGSIVSTEKGVLYTSNNGLILIGPGGGVNLTFDIIRKDDWAKILDLGQVHATFFMNGYYAYSGTTEGAFQDDAFQTIDAFQQEVLSTSQVGAHINLSDERLGLMTLTCDAPTHNVMADIWTGETLVIRSGKVFHVDRRAYDPRQSYLWRSKLVQINYMENFAAAKVYFTAPLGSTAKPPYGNPPGLTLTTFRYYADGHLKMSRLLRKSGAQFRLPSGFKADTVQFELSGQMMIFNMQVATSARELRDV